MMANILVRHQGQHYPYLLGQEFTEPPRHPQKGSHFDESEISSGIRTRSRKRLCATGAYRVRQAQRRVVVSEAVRSKWFIMAVGVAVAVAIRILLEPALVEWSSPEPSNWEADGVRELRDAIDAKVRGLAACFGRMFSLAR